MDKAGVWGISLLFLVLMGGCASSPEERVETPDMSCPGCNVILIVIDALRLDHLGCYGYSKNTSPVIDELCGNSIFFDDVTAPSSLSYFSFAGLLNGGPDFNAATDQSLPNIMKNEGYHTFAFQGNGHLDPQSFGTGFDEYHELWGVVGGPESDINEYSYPAGRINAELFKTIKEHSGERFFIYVQYMDVHTPSISPDVEGAGLPSDTIEAYDSALSSVDASLGDLLGVLSNLGLANRTVIIITADHGEEMWEHGRKGHGATLYQEVIRVPLIIHMPRMEKGLWYREPVHTFDIMPTLLGMVRCSSPEGLFGVDVSVLPAQDSRMFYSLTDHEKIRVAARCQDTKLILTFNLTRGDWRRLYYGNTSPSDLREQIAGKELFNLSADPLEQHNLIGTQDAEMLRTRSLLEGRALFYAYAFIRSLGQVFEYPASPYTLTPAERDYLATMEAGATAS